MTDEARNGRDGGATGSGTPDDGGGGDGGGGESRGTVILAGSVNAIIALGKFVVGTMTGSSAMLSEGAHSVADTLNEGFLYTALRRSSRKPDARHPFGYGKERFFWSLIAAVGIFVAGAGFSYLEAYRTFTNGESSEAFLPAYIMLGIAALLEGSSWARALLQVRKEAREVDRGMLEHIKASSDPTVKTVASEDSAALVGILLAATGLVLHQTTGHAFWEGIASALIGTLLVFVAYALGRDSMGLLIGEAASHRTRDRIDAQLAEYPEIDEVLEVLTMRIGTGQVLLAVRLDFREDLSAEDVEELSTRIENDLHDCVPEVAQVFLDATDKGTRQADEGPHWADGKRVRRPQSRRPTYPAGEAAAGDVPSSSVGRP